MVLSNVEEPGPLLINKALQMALSPEVRSHVWFIKSVRPPPPPPPLVPAPPSPQLMSLRIPRLLSTSSTDAAHADGHPILQGHLLHAD